MTASIAAAQVDARVVDQALVASFMNAEPPKVWRADMAKLNTATLELRSDAGRFRLVMITQGGEEDVAIFTTRDDGTAALQAVMQAMLAPSGVAQASAAPVAAAATAAAAAPVKKGGFFKWLFKLVLWLVAIFVALMILAGLFLGDKTGQLISAINPGDAPIVAPGTAVPADEFFR